MRNRTMIFDARSIQQGVVAGLLMAVFLSFLSVTGAYGSSSLKYFKYLLLLGVIARALYYIRSKVNENQFFGSAIKKGFVISLIGGVIVTLVNFGLFLIYPDYSIEKFNISPDTLGQLHLVNAALIVEIVVLGLIGTFVIYQGLKHNKQ